MATEHPIWLCEQDVAASVSLGDAVAAVRETYLRWAGTVVRQLPKALLAWGSGTLHATGAVDVSGGGAGAALAVAKTWIHTPRGANPLLICWDTASGQLVAVVEAFALGQLRTSAVCAVAADVLAAPSAETLAVIGSGKQAEGQVAAIAAVRKLSDIRVFSPTRDHRVQLADRISKRSGLAAREVGSVREAVREASVVITVTRACDPFLGRQMLAPGVHLNAVGAISPERAELQPDVAAAAECVAADDVQTARRLAARELSDLGADDVVPLADLLASGYRRPPEADLTIFKAVGSGVSDLAVAELVLSRARAAGLGRPLDPPTAVRPDLWSTA